MSHTFFERGEKFSCGGLALLVTSLMPNFNLQKVEGCLDPVLEKVIMILQGKQRRKLNGL